MPSTRISQLLLPLLLLMHAAAVSALPLPAMVADMQDNAAAIASQYDELEQARHLQRNSDSAGWRLFGGVDVGQYRELDRLGRQSYTGSGGHLGLRYPLLGSRQSQHSSMLDGRIALDKARQSTALVRSEQQEQLRLAYIDWWHLHEISAWCERIDRQARSERQLTAERGSKQRLRTSEVLWVEQRWESLLRNCHGLEQHEAVLREHLAYLYGNLLPANARPHPEPLPLEPAVVASWLPLLEQHPAL